MNFDSSCRRPAGRRSWRGSISSLWNCRRRIQRQSCENGTSSVGESSDLKPWCRSASKGASASSSANGNCKSKSLLTTWSSSASCERSRTCSSGRGSFGRKGRRGCSKRRRCEAMSWTSRESWDGSKGAVRSARRWLRLRVPVQIAWSPRRRRRQIRLKWRHRRRHRLWRTGSCDASWKVSEHWLSGSRARSEPFWHVVLAT
mmetsp:Transcript_45735/g.108725  ORF Transcript_45735/g.108725 Transcript_45735/m.108725 type:complete len:202 (+) Transcript_45735:253-858(+)